MPRTSSLIIFLVIALSILGGMHFYIWVRLVRDPGLGDPWRRVLGVALVLLAFSFPAAMLLRRSGTDFARLFSMAAFGWLGVAFLLFVTLLASDVVRLIAFGLGQLSPLLRRPNAPSVPDPTRRAFVARAAAGTVVAFVGGASAYGVRRAGGPADIEEVPVSIARLPRELSGFTIAQISDLHVGPTIGEKEVRRVIEQTKGLKPDLVAITGDLVDAGVRELGPVVAAFRHLEAPHGVFFVTGNHEYYAGFAEWEPFLRSLGMRVLRNERVAVGDSPSSKKTFDLAGVDDYSQNLDLGRALKGRDDERALVLLAHQPRGIDAAVRAGVDLQLSGHTHGGQIFPFNYVVGLAQPYVRGLHRHVEPSVGRTGQIYVSRGAGYWGPPMRLGSPPEITKVILIPG